MMNGVNACNCKQAVIFMSGSGSNAEALLRYEREHADCRYHIGALVTDRPELSRTREIGQAFDLPVIGLDIFDFYRRNGEANIGLISPRRRELREMWTDELRKKLVESGLNIDFILLAGFEPLCNITGDYPCLNVHPGDLTVEENHLRILNGLGVKPVELAIVKGFGSLRSSVIVAQPFTGKESDVDAGPILGISPAMPIDLCGNTLEELQRLFAVRPEKTGKDFSDALREVAKVNIERLKYAGDHVIFPQVAQDFALGKFHWRPDGLLNYRVSCDAEFVPVKTIEYGKDGSRKLWPVK